MTDTGRRARLIFVCHENAGRSQMAEAFARMLGGGGVEAESAGVRPAAAISPKAIAAMQEVGYDLGRHRPKGLDEFAGRQFDVAVTLGCGGDACPDIQAAHKEDWDIPVPKGATPEQFRSVRDQVRERVVGLLARLPG